MLEKKIARIALYHDGKFDFCPDKPHSHECKITMTAAEGLTTLRLDPIIPSSHGNIKALCDMFKGEIKSLAVVEIFFADIETSFIEFYEN